MDLSLAETQQALRNTAREFIQKKYPKDVINHLDDSDTGFSPEIWQEMADLGWMKLILPKEYGGAGSNFADLGILYEEMGRVCLAPTHFSSAVLCALIILGGGNEEQKNQLLPSIGDGQLIVSLAFTEPEYGWGPECISLEASRKNDGFILNGTKLFVHDAQVAQRFLCVAKTGGTSDPEKGISLFLVDRDAAGISCRNLEGFVGGKQNEVIFDSVEVAQASVIGEVDRGWPILADALKKATPILCSYMVGGCLQLFEMTVGYCRTRKQFGVHIGTFQRVQDHVINIVNEMDAAKWTTYEALWKLDENKPGIEEAVSLAKAVSSDAFHNCAISSQEVHAGVGIMKEYGLYQYQKMARTLYSYLGDPAYHRKRLAKMLEL